MAVRAVTLSKELKYVSEDDPAKGTDDETTFLLHPLSAPQSAQVSDLLASFSADAASGGEASSQMKVHQAAILAVRFGLFDWHNFLDENGEQIPFKSRQQTIGGKTAISIVPELLDRVPMGEIFGMYRLLMETSSPSGDASKN